MACFPCRQREKNEKKMKEARERGELVYIETEPYIGPGTVCLTTGCCFLIGPFSLLCLLFPIDRKPKEVLFCQN